MRAGEKRHGSQVRCEDESILRMIVSIQNILCFCRSLNDLIYPFDRRRRDTVDVRFDDGLVELGSLAKES